MDVKLADLMALKLVDLMAERLELYLAVKRVYL